MSGQVKLKGVTLITPKFRANWVYLFEPRESNQEGKKPQYSVTCLFEKGQDLKPLNDAILAAITEKYGVDRNKWPKMAYLSLKDQGTALRVKDGQEILPPGYTPGALYMEAKSYTQPGITGPKKEQLLPSDLYSGCYMRAEVTFKVIEYLGKVGVTCYVQNVQKWSDGEKLGGGRIPAEDAFSAIDEGPAVSDEVTPNELAGLI